MPTRKRIGDGARLGREGALLVAVEPGLRVGHDDARRRRLPRAGAATAAPSKGTPIYTFVVSLGDVDGPLGAASTRGADGISFKWDPASEPMNASVVDGIHRKGFRVILWTINAPEDIAAAWAAQPDVIETDVPDFLARVPR